MDNRDEPIVRGIPGIKPGREDEYLAHREKMAKLERKGYAAGILFGWLILIFVVLVLAAMFLGVIALARHVFHF